MFDIADITSGEERRGGKAEVLCFSRKEGCTEIGNRNTGGRGGANGLSRRMSGIQCSDGSGGGGLDACVRLGGWVCALLDVDVFGGGGGGGGGPA